MNLEVMDKANFGLENAKNEIKELRKYVLSSENPEELKNIFDKSKLAKEWARIKKLTIDIKKEIIMLEVDCLVKLHNMEYYDYIPKHGKQAAKYFAENYDRVESLIESYDSSSAIGLYRQIDSNGDPDFLTNIGRKYALGKEHSELYNAADHIHKYESSLREFIETYVDYGIPFTVEDIKEEMMANYESVFENTNGGDVARDLFDSGLKEVCRQAIMKSPIIKIEDMEAPRFVTCPSDEGRSWVRIPFENAKFTHFDQMIELRREQLEQDKKAFEKLLKIRNYLNDNAKDKDEHFSEIINRIKKQGDNNLEVV